MKIVIDIPEEKLGWIKEYPDVYTGWQNESIRNGTPLPKGHGRLIDADVLVSGFEDNYEFCEEVNATPTIIKADKEEQNVTN